MHMQTCTVHSHADSRISDCAVVTILQPIPLLTAALILFAKSCQIVQVNYITQYHTIAIGYQFLLLAEIVADFYTRLITCQILYWIEYCGPADYFHGLLSSMGSENCVGHSESDW